MNGNRSGGGIGIGPNSEAHTIRACMISFYFHPRYSGSAVQAHNLCKSLAQLGVECTIVSANLTGSPMSEQVDGIQVYRLPIVKHRNFAILSFWVSLAVFLFVHQRKIDVIHAHGTYQHSIASIVGRALGKRTILKIAMANSDIAFGRQGRIWGKLNRFLVDKFDRYVATSRDIDRECTAQGLDSDKVVRIPNGVDTEVFRPVASALEKQELRRSAALPDEPIACFVGVVDRRKNVDGILRVWARVRDRLQFGHLVLVGPVPDDEPSRRFYRTLEEFIAGHDLVDTVTFAGQQKDVASYLRMADVFFFPSRGEGMPNVVLEAMSSGLPCVGSKISGTVDLVDHGDTGYLFDVDDEAALAAALGELLSDPDRAWRMGQAARRLALERFSLRNTAAVYESLYRSLLSRDR